MKALPPQIKFIIGNEAAERFSFYGMRNILTVFLVDYLLSRATAQSEREAQAKSIFHLFVVGVYYFPLLGGALADRFLGKYRTILWLSIVYCAGHGCLALFESDKTGFFVGLFLIALGSGGIKPCVSAFVGDQFTSENKSLAKTVFAIFYWSINFGSFFASLLIPKTLERYGPKVAFGIPGVFMALATLIFWLGRGHYVHSPPQGRNPHSFLRVIRSALKHRSRRPTGEPLLDAALAEHPPDAVAGTRAVFRVLKIFAAIPFFWMLFDQKASAWVLQAKRMDLDVLGFRFAPSQLQFINPLLVMMLVPFTAAVVYPAAERFGYTLTPLRRMTIGMFFAAASFVMVAGLELWIAGGAKPTVLWQLAPYLALTMAEVLVSVTGLEFAYSQAPPSMKSTVMSFWNLTVAIGNLVVAVVAKLNVFSGAASFLFYAALISFAGIFLGFAAKKYVTVDYYRERAG
ncbi:MAG: POT family MFS transporter [Myxococcales bacterium]|nr:POT family MFS transporter [Myxococcales bacterium]